MQVWGWSGCSLPNTIVVDEADWLITLIDKILLQRWCHCVERTQHYHMYLISHYISMSMPRLVHLSILFTDELAFTVIAEHASSTIDIISVEAHASPLQLGFFDGALYSNHTGNTFVTLFFTSVIILGLLLLQYHLAYTIGHFLVSSVWLFRWAAGWPLMRSSWWIALAIV